MSYSESDILFLNVDLRQGFLSIPDTDKISLFGDLNARKDYQTWNFLGLHTAMIFSSYSFATSIDLMTGNTCF